jgi:dolichol-phosphate mannosyltransferase
MQHFLASRAARLITIDADLSHDPALTVRMIAAVGPQGLAIGSRYLAGRPRVEWAFGRMLSSRLGNIYIRAVTGLPVKDCTSGFRCYSRAALERLDLGAIGSNGYAFQVEMLYWIWQAGCLISEVEIVYRDRLYGESKLGPAIVSESLVLPWRLVLRREARSALKPIALEQSRGRPAA